MKNSNFACKFLVNSNSIKNNAHEFTAQLLRHRRVNTRTRAGGKAVDLGGPSGYQGGQSFKLSTKAAVFKRVSLLIGGPSSPWPPLGAGPDAGQPKKIAGKRFMALFSSLRYAKQHFKSLPKLECHKASKYCANYMLPTHSAFFKAFGGTEMVSQNLLLQQ